MFFSAYVSAVATNERYQKYLAAIRDAEQSYKECNNTKHECFKDVILRDLKPFREKGISEEMIDAAKTRYLPLDLHRRFISDRLTSCFFKTKQKFWVIYLLQRYILSSNQR